MSTTPMMQQYERLKAKHADCIVLFRLGDFYEAFNDDAKEISKILNITLTGRGKGETRHPMAGIPHHALQNYLKKLIKAGKKVAIADQLEEAQTGRIVERGVTKIITAGTFTDESVLDESRNNYLVAVFYNTKSGYHLAFVDLTTAEFKVKKLDTYHELSTIIFRLNPSEILVPQTLFEKFKSDFIDSYIQIIHDDDFKIDDNYQILLNHLKTTSLKGFGIEKTDETIIPSGIIIKYLKETQKTDLIHIKKISKEIDDDYMTLDPSTITNLELVWPSDGVSIDTTLFGILNEANTAMGQRKLRNWILRPLINIEPILERHNALEELLIDPMRLSDVRNLLNEICDLERIVSKLGTGNINARDLLFLQSSLNHVIKLLEFSKSYKNQLINLEAKFKENTKIIKEVISIINNSIKEDPPITITEGGIIKQGYNKELDEVRELMKRGKTWLQELQVSEIKRTKITNLKIKFNNVFGYYIEVSKSNLDKIPDNYIRKQTLVNAERFVTEELKEWESKILNASDKASSLEYEIFQSIKDEISKHIELLLFLADNLATLDVICNFAHLARKHSYTKPKLNLNHKLEIADGRHPVVERHLKSSYVPNDILLDNTTQQVIILTGPNMSGKSTYIRQIALISLMAQIGSFVPAREANLCIVDKIFTRVGASDNLARGESTFMVEMNETANILNNSSENSLIILDEVGRGTSTYDGVAIAWAIVEYLHDVIGAKTLFATHYHELIDLEGKLKKVKNYNVDVLEENGEIEFTRKVKVGGTDQSYGVHVAKMAGVPDLVISRANQILLTLEQESMLEVKSIESELIEPQDQKIIEEEKSVVKSNRRTKPAPKEQLKIF